MPLLEVNDLKTHFFTREGVVQAVDGVSFAIEKGQTLGIVGESGCGKSVTALSIMGLIPKPPAKIVGGQVLFDGRDLTELKERELESVRGKEIAMIFQDPMTSLNPTIKIGTQITETILAHEDIPKEAARKRAADLLEEVRIPRAKERLDDYPHRFSGGMRQRVMIAIALSCNPRLLIADEPTTALDVTIQAQILDLLRELQRERGMALILVTHNMGVVAEIAQRVAVMYAGQVVEERSAASLFADPQHPYTAALLDAMPERAEGRARLATIPGVVPGLYDRPVGCLFSTRCRYATERSCSVRPPLREWRDGKVRCHYPLGDSARDVEIARDRPVACGTAQ